MHYFFYLYFLYYNVITLNIKYVFYLHGYKYYEPDFHNSMNVIDQLKASKCKLQIFHRGYYIINRHFLLDTKCVVGKMMVRFNASKQSNRLSNEWYTLVFIFSSSAGYFQIGLVTFESVLSSNTMYIRHIDILTLYRILYDC